MILFWYGPHSYGVLYIVMPYTVMACMVMDCTVMDYIAMSRMVMAPIDIAYMVMAYIVMAYMVMAYTYNSVDQQHLVSRRASKWSSCPVAKSSAGLGPHLRLPVSPSSQP